MPSNLTMPRLSDTMEVGTIVKWHATPGQKVKAGDVIADIETDKATMELQTFDDGVIGELAVKEGQSVPVGTVILRWEGGAESAPAPSPATSTTAATSTRSGAGADQPAGSAPASPTESDSAAAPTGTHDQTVHAERVFASPLARKLATELGVDLARVQGTGPSGRIVRRDIEAAASNSRGQGSPAHVNAEATAALGGPAAPSAGSTPPAAPAPGAPIFKPKPLPESRPLSPAAAATSVPPIAALVMPTIASALQRRSVPLSNMRRTIAARLVESKTTIPHYQVTVSARMDALLALRSQLNEQLASQGVRLSVNDFVVRAAALAMHAHPFINARWNPSRGQESIELLDQVNIGVAISLPVQPDLSGGGLVVATIRNADQKGLRLISAETRAMAEKARAKGLAPEDMSDSTFTISNLGMYGVDHFTAIINPPNAAILAVGAAIQGPVVETGPDGKPTLAVGTTMSMTMSSDHRLIDGAMAAQYLQTLKDLLEKPATLLV
jgi:pyruvate dehydrogenase E2 component (dihydrolipoamide acetyltransferase)